MISLQKTLSEINDTNGSFYSQFFQQQIKQAGKIIPLHMRFQIPFRIINFNAHGFHIMVVAHIKNYAFNLLIDTGATQSVFDLNRVQKITLPQDIHPYDRFFMGIGTSKIETYCTLVQQMVFESCVLYQKNIVLMNLDSVNKAYASFDLPRVDGVLGGDILWQHKAVIDYQKKNLELEVS